MVLRRKLTALLLLSAVAGCSKPLSCPVASQQRTLVTSLYFGRAIPGGGEVGDAAWAAFAGDVIGANFPDGFTVYDAVGQWRNPASGAVGKEQTKVVQIAAPRTQDFSARIAAVVEAYRRRFHQEAVGIVSSEVCAAF